LIRLFFIFLFFAEIRFGKEKEGQWIKNKSLVTSFFFLYYAPLVLKFFPLPCFAIRKNLAKDGHSIKKISSRLYF